MNVIQVVRISISKMKREKFEIVIEMGFIYLFGS